MLERCINIIKETGLKNINKYISFQNQIFEFIKNKKFSIDIQVIEDGKKF